MAEPFLIAFKKIVHVILENNFYKSMEFISKRGIVKAFTNERGYKNETYSSTTSQIHGPHDAQAKRHSSNDRPMR